MSSVPKPQSIQAEDDMSKAYSLFIKLFLEKFLRASGIWLEAVTDREGRSLHRKLGDNPLKAIEQLTGGKTDLLRRIVLEKFEAALIQWAIEAMGDNFEKFVGRGLERFFAAVMLKVMGVGTYNDAGIFTERPRRRFLSGVRESPLYFPLQLKKRADFPLQDPYKLKREYATLLAVVKDIKNKTRRNPGAQKCALIEKLPGTNTQTADGYQGMKPSQIALAYMARKYRLPLSGEGLKKHLPKRIPQDVIELELRRQLIG